MKTTLFVVVVFLLLSFTTANQKNCKPCSCPSDLEVNCTSANLKSVPITFNPRLTSYIIRDNDLSGLGVSRPFDAYLSLINLDLSNNKLQEIPVNALQNQKQLKVSVFRYQCQQQNLLLFRHFPSILVSVSC